MGNSQGAFPATVRMFPHGRMVGQLAAADLLRRTSCARWRPGALPLLLAWNRPVCSRVTDYSLLMVSVALALAQPPLPEGNAAGRCGLALMRGLLAHGVDVHAVAARRAFPDAAAQDEPIDPALPVTVVGQPVRMPSKTAVAQLPRRLRAQAARIRRPRGELGSGPFADMFERTARDADIVHLEETETGWAPGPSDTPRLLHVHYLTALDRDAGHLGRRRWREVREFSSAERRLVGRHRWLVASSPVVATRLRAIAPRATVVEVPLPLSVEDYPQAKVGEPVAGLIGTASWEPTYGAMIALLESVWPRVSRAAPKAELLVAGRGTDGLAGGPASNAHRVTVLGEVASGVEFLQSIAVLVYPCPRGSGAKMKVLEAMACGVPVVTTTCGAEGAPESDGLIVCRTDEEVARATSSLVLDPDERRQRGERARHDLRARHAPFQATAPLVDLYAEMAAAQ